MELLLSREFMLMVVETAGRLLTPLADVILPTLQEIVMSAKEEHGVLRLGNVELKVVNPSALQ